MEQHFQHAEIRVAKSSSFDSRCCVVRQRARYAVSKLAGLSARHRWVLSRPTCGLIPRSYIFRCPKRVVKMRKPLQRPLPTVFIRHDSTPEGEPTSAREGDICLFLRLTP
jgi:hypothetical protein